MKLESEKNKQTKNYHYQSHAVVADEIIKETKNDNVVVKKLDLSSQKSVRDFAADINKTESKIDVLIHNAGYAETFNKYKTGDGIELIEKI
jgi:retinol dehydrogenase 14